MRFENTFELAGDPERVITLFADTRLMASFLPGASVDSPMEDGSYPAWLEVEFGPKRIRFKGHLSNAIDPSAQRGSLVGHASTDLRGAKLSVHLDYQLSPGPSGTQVFMVAESEMTGMLAEFARTGGAAITQALLEEFAKRFSAYVQSGHAESPNRNASASATPDPSVSGFWLLAKIFRNAVAAMFTRLRK